MSDLHVLLVKKLKFTEEVTVTWIIVGWERGPQSSFRREK